MKRISYITIALFLFTGVVNAKPVSKEIAQTVATNFYSRTLHSVNPTLTLAYTELTGNGQPAYYVFNVNTSEGFVIVSAEDAAHPILGYSNKGPYVIPKDNNNVAWWMNCRKQEIAYARTNNMLATSDITNEWTAYINNTTLESHAPAAIQAVSPLLQTTWDQSPYYNAMCPGSSVTGCVATAMAQIMKYWAYPPHGHGSSSYWDSAPYGYQQNFGYLKANYDTAKYIWSAMPTNLSSNNSQVAKLMYDCGISVDMDYSPFESGAWVITGDYPVCSQISYVKYFGYNPSTIQGLYNSKYTLANWQSLIQNELNNGRPVQYVGWDSISPNSSSGHTWVCDGYNASAQFDMNWGWGGADNGYYSLTALNGGGYQFNWWDEVLLGIEPPAASPYFTATPTFGCSGMTVQFTDRSITVSNLPITSRKWLFPGGNPSTSTDTNPSVKYSTPGTYNVSEIISDSKGTDTLTRQAYISVTSVATLPLAQGFQSDTFPTKGWVINNPNNSSYVWQLNTAVGGFGNSTQSMYFNNCQGYDDYAPPGKAGLDIIGQRQQIYTPEYNFTAVTKPEIYFDVAYAPYSTTFSDTLNIYYSTDCGATFQLIYSKGGLTLGTAGTYVTNGADTNKSGCFLPLKNNWRTDTIHIPAIAGVSSVMFSFENRSGNGSPLYIDNINIPGPPKQATDIQNISSASSVKVYPNPNNGEFNFIFGGQWALNNEVDIEIFNVLGEKIYSSHPAIVNSQLSINLEAQPKGVYIYRIFSEAGSAVSTGRLIIE